MSRLDGTEPLSFSDLTPEFASSTLLLCELDLDEGPLKPFEQVLNDQERSAAERRTNSRLHSRFVRARGALRLVLGALVKRPPRSLNLDLGEYGKPTLAGGPCFNLSHSEGSALLAVSFAEGMGPADLGVDLEHVHDWPDLDDLAQTVYTPPERAWCDAQGTKHDKRNAFFRLWTAKESFMKATGEGLSRPLQEFRIAWDENERGGHVLSHPHGTDLGYSVLAIPTGSELEAAVCLRETWKILPLRRVALSFRDGRIPQS